MLHFAFVQHLCHCLAAPLSSREDTNNFFQETFSFALSPLTASHFLQTIAWLWELSPVGGLHSPT